MSISFEAFEKLCQQSYDLAEDIKRIENEEIKPRQEELRRVDAQIMEIMNSMDKTSYKSSYGTIVKQTRYSVQTPKTIEDKKAYFKFLTEKSPELFWSQVGVNSQTLNAFYKQEMEIAKEEGNFDFEIPGIGEPVASEIIIRRKR